MKCRCIICGASNGTMNRWFGMFDIMQVQSICFYLRSGQHLFCFSKHNLKTRLFLGLGLISLMTVVLFCGISRDPEFHEPTVFVKHRPTLKLHFYTPIGESDLKLEDLNEDKKREELLYREFVKNEGVYTYNLNRLWFLPPVLIQLTLTFLSLAVKRIEIKKYGILIHFLINIIFSTLGVSFMLHLDTPWMILILIGLVLINIWTTKFAVIPTQSSRDR